MYSAFILLSTLAGQPYLVAENNRFSHMASRFRDNGTPFDATGFAIVLSVALLLALFVWFLAHWHARRETRIVNNPRGLFRELCRAHQLSLAERRLLIEIAEWHGLADTALLFIDAERLQPADMCEKLACQSEARQLQGRLFSAGAAD